MRARQIPPVAVPWCEGEAQAPSASEARVHERTGSLEQARGHAIEGAGDQGVAAARGADLVDHVVLLADAVDPRLAFDLASVSVRVLGHRLRAPLRLEAIEVA